MFTGVTVPDYVMLNGRVTNNYRIEKEPVPVAARSKASVCCRSPAEIVGSNPTGGMDVCLLWMCVVRGAGSATG